MRESGGSFDPPLFFCWVIVKSLTVGMITLTLSASANSKNHENKELSNLAYSLNYSLSAIDDDGKE